MSHLFKRFAFATITLFSMGTSCFAMDPKKQDEKDLVQVSIQNDTRKPLEVFILDCPDIHHLCQIPPDQSYRMSLLKENDRYQKMIYIDTRRDIKAVFRLPGVQLRFNEVVRGQEIGFSPQIRLSGYTTEQPSRVKLETKFLDPRKLQISQIPIEIVMVIKDNFLDTSLGYAKEKLI